MGLCFPTSAQALERESDVMLDQTSSPHPLISAENLVKVEVVCPPECSENSSGQGSTSAWKLKVA